MKATIRDSDALLTVRPLDVVAYLKDRGWQEEQRLERASFWATSVGTTTHEIFLPFDMRAAGYAQRIAETLSELEKVENRSQLEILEDLMFANADVIRPRLLGPTDGTISLEAGKIAYEQARALMLAAACAAVEPRDVYAKRKPERAMSYLKHARFGASKRGSYILTIISPVTPRLTIEKDLFGEVYPEEPFERRTVRTLATALRQASVAGREAATTGNFESMKSAVAYGVSANLCEALVSLHNDCGNEGLDFRFSWSPSRGTPDDCPSEATISPDLIPVLAEAARIFRETGTQEEAEIVGTVHKLERKEEAGKVTVSGIVDGTPRMISIDLSGPDHSLAVRSYDERIPLRCNGELQKEGRSWVLKNPREVTLVIA